MLSTSRIANLSADEDAVLCLAPVGAVLENTAEIKVLVDPDYHAHNTFEDPERVSVKTYTADPGEEIVIPRAGVVMIQAEIRAQEDQ